MFNLPNNSNTHHRGNIKPLNSIEARYVISLAMSAPVQCVDLDPDQLAATYVLADGEPVVIRASILLSDSQVAVRFDAGELDDAAMTEVSAIHEAIASLVPVLADGLPTIREVA